MKKKSIDILIIAEEFLLYKKSIGYKYKTGAFHLKALIKFLVKNNQKYSVPSKHFLITWCQEVKFSKGSMYNRIVLAREFSKYLILKGYDTAYVIPRKYGIKLETHIPYFFTSEEIADFFYSCDHIKKRKENPGRELVIPTIFRLLYCCGLRCKEARTLLCKNVNLKKNYIDILQSKGPKSRRIFINEELANELKTYNNKMNIIFSERLYFFSKNPFGFIVFSKL
jgi:site-specific recombinase XerD